MKYYPGIDGLRAVAVMAVILFHLDVPGFPGGYVGVDVFFVISGYLITSHLLQELATGSLSLAAFYERRARRILPLLIAVMAFTLGVTCAAYHPITFEATGTSIAGCSTFISNIIFMRRKGYFDPSVHEDPLLHTWSLSVEEQFYIFLPLFLLLLYRIFKKRIGILLLAVALCSFCINLILSYKWPRVAFYSSPTRAWEFLAGSLLATSVIPGTQNKTVLTALSSFGLCLLLLPVFLFNNKISYPGMFALAPVAGAAALVYGCVYNDGTINKLLSLRPVVFTGRISYSLYMWHWPLVVFASLCVDDQLTAIQKTAFLLVLFPVSVLSYYYIEQPVRRKQVLKSRSSVFVVSIVTLAAFTIAGIVIKRSKGMPFSTTTGQQSAADTTWESFSSRHKAAPHQPQYYIIGDKGSAPCFVLWGDSHAMALSVGIDSMARALGISGYLVTSPSTPPLSGVNIKDRPVSLAANNAGIIQFIRAHTQLKTIILTARWSNYCSNDFTRLANDSSIANALQRTTDTLLALNRSVYVTMPIPELKTSLNKILFRHKILEKDVFELATDTAAYTLYNRIAIKAINGLPGSAHIVHVERHLLSGSKFLISEKGSLLYRDFHHLTAAGSIKVAPAFAEALRDCMDTASQ